MTKRMTKQLSMVFSRFSLIACALIATALAHAAPEESSVIEEPAGMAATLPAAGAPEHQEQIKEKSIIRFAGIVQYLSGNGQRIGSQGMRTPLEFKSIFYEDERLHLDDGAMLKIVTRNDCTAVLYGEAQALTPNVEKPWRVKSRAIRWLCPKGAKDSFVIRGARFDVDGGELLLDGRQLLILRGKVTTPGNPTELPVMKLLEADGISWKPQQPEPHPFRLWSFNQERKAPQESVQIPQPPRPVAVKKTRWGVGPTGGNQNLDFDKGNLSKSGRGGDGGRIFSHWQKNKGSLMFIYNSITFEDRGNNSSSGAQPTNGTFQRTSLNTLLAGYRLYHQKPFSPYFLAGGGSARTRAFINQNQSPYNYNAEIDYEFYVATIALGVDAFYSPSWLPWLGIYGGAEVNYTRSLWRGARSVYHEFNNGSQLPPDAIEPWNLSMGGPQIMIGAILLF